MIAHLTGTVSQAGANWVILDLGGFGLHLACTPATAAGVRIGEKATLHTSLIVREDSLTLYGFGELGEKECFDLVQNASGVGPKLAQAIVSVLSPADLKSAILQEDVSRLCAVPGIGKKGAQKLIIELKDKVLTLTGDISPNPVTRQGVSNWRDQVQAGLQGLGYSARDAEAACEAVAPMAEDQPDTAIGLLMRAALASLAKR